MHQSQPQHLDAFKIHAGFYLAVSDLGGGEHRLDGMHPYSVARPARAFHVADDVGDQNGEAVQTQPR